MLPRRSLVKTITPSMKNWPEFKTKQIAWLSLLLVLTLASCKKDKLEIIGTTEKFKITSAIVQDEYEIRVYQPPNYSSNLDDNQLIVGLRC